MDNPSVCFISPPLVQIKVHLTKYLIFFRYNKSLHLFETHDAVFFIFITSCLFIGLKIYEKIEKKKRKNKKAQCVWKRYKDLF